MGAEMEDMVFPGVISIWPKWNGVDSPGEAIPNNEISAVLPPKLGYEEENFKWMIVNAWKINVDLGLSSPVKGIDLAYLREHGFARLMLVLEITRAPHKNVIFPTATGKNCPFRVLMMQPTLFAGALHDKCMKAFQTWWTAGIACLTMLASRERSV